MKVKLLTSLAGENFSHAAGEEIEMDEAEAKRFIEKGLAEPVKKTNAKRTSK